MAFSGDLVDYPLAELLFYLSASHRSGWLTIESDTVEITFTLAQGELIAAHSDNIHQRLGQRLIADGIITAGQLKDALQMQTRSHPLVALGSALVTFGYASPAAVRQVLRDQAIDLIVQILVHPQCTFCFKRGLPDTHGIEVDIALERGVLDAIRHVDEWSTRQLWTSTVCLNPEISADMLVGVIQTDWPTLEALMDGAANLDEISAATGWSPGAAHESLKRLQTLDLIFVNGQPQSQNHQLRQLPVAMQYPGGYALAYP